MEEGGGGVGVAANRTMNKFDCRRRLTLFCDRKKKSEKSPSHHSKPNLNFI